MHAGRLLPAGDGSDLTLSRPRPQQCLNMLSPADTKPLRALIEEQFDSVKQYAESRAALLPVE